MHLFNIALNRLIQLKYILTHTLLQSSRRLKYRLLSNCKNIIGTPKCEQPVLFLGEGQISFGNNVNLGYRQSPNFYNCYSYFDVRKPESKITIGDNVWINNNCVLICNGGGISIGNKTLLGVNVEIIDSDFHGLSGKSRNSVNAKTQKVTIEENVFIGNNVIIMKGVTIGKNSVIGNGSIVTKSIPENVIAAGNPAAVIREL